MLTRVFRRVACFYYARKLVREMRRHTHRERLHEEEVECAICRRRWMARYPAPARRLECPDCGYMNDIETAVL